MFFKKTKQNPECLQLKAKYQELCSLKQEFTLALSELQGRISRGGERQAREKTLAELKKKKEEIEALIKQFPEINKVKKEIKEITKNLTLKLNQRAREFGLTPDYSLKPPETPKKLTPEAIKAMNEIFGPNNLELAIIPDPAELHNLDENYAQMMYPKAQTEKDKQRGLISYRPDWFSQQPASLIAKSDETWGEAYLRSMAEEIKQLKGRVILIESIQKPMYKNGRQLYGSKEGDKPNLDPLLPIFKEVFGPDANRFNHSHDYLTNLLMPKVKEKLLTQFKKKNINIKSDDFEVILVPASLFNLQTTFNHPANSQTNTWECSSKIFLKDQNQDRGYCVGVGGFNYGGAGGVTYFRHYESWPDGGARLAVVFKS